MPQTSPMKWSLISMFLPIFIAVTLALKKGTMSGGHLSSLKGKSLKWSW